MGYSFSVVVGAGIKCEKPKETIQKGYSRCSNIKCPNHHEHFINSKYCDECGHKIEEYARKIEMSHYRILEEAGIDDDLFHIVSQEDSDLQDITYYFQNVYEDRTCYHFSEQQEYDYLKITENLTQELLNKFNDKFKNEIELLKDFYQSVEVEFIVLPYTS